MASSASGRATAHLIRLIRTYKGARTVNCLISSAVCLYSDTPQSAPLFDGGWLLAGVWRGVAVLAVCCSQR